jgi:hypothetical protein
MKIRISLYCAAIAFAAAFIPASTLAQTTDARVAEPAPATETVPHLVQFNGTLKDSAARPISGVTSVTFAVYAEQDGGAALWTETQNVLADSSGHFTALLGTATSGGFPSDLIGTGQSRWLGVTVARQSELPRVMLASVPYALKAGDADTLGGLPASSYVTTQQLAARTTTPVVSGGGSTIIATPGVASANAAEAITTGAQSVIQANPSGSGTTDYIPLWTSGSNLGNSLLFQTGGKVGIGTTTPAATLDINGGEILRGGYYEYPEDTATASNGGKQSHSFQWLSSVFNSSSGTAVNPAFGFRAIPLNNDTSNPSAKLDLFYGLGGPTGTINDLGLSINSSGVITFVPSQTFTGESLSFNGDTTNYITASGQPLLGSYGNADSIFLGLAAGGGLAESSSSGENSAVGYSALHNITTGSRNTAMGFISLYADNAGTDNTGIGYGAIEQTSTGSDNTALGSNTLGGDTTGSYNTTIGALSGQTVSTGSYNTFLGYGANVGSGGGALQNATAIGANAIVNESNAIVLGGGGGFLVKVGIGTQTPGYELDIEDTSVGTGPFGVITGVSGHTAVAGYNNNTSGATGSNGGFFYSASPNGAGVYGLNTGGGSAGYFAGNVTVTGTLTKGGGSFKIDDPIDPANKYLSHSFVESPDMMNIYNGNVTTNAKGYATVEMPAWFEALNRDFRYQLTTINSFSRATVAAELKDGKFRIRTSQPNVKVSWQVTGIRHDAWADAHRIPNEEDKPADEQGKYLHPELFGAGPDKSVAYAHAGPAAAANGTPANAPAEEASPASSASATAGHK